MDKFAALILQAAPGGNPPKTDLLTTFLVYSPIILLFVVMYVLMVRPQKRKEQARQKMLAALKKGDQIVTIGGLHGTIRSIKDNELTLVVDEQKDIRLKFSREAVSQVVGHTEIK